MSRPTPETDAAEFLISMGGRTYDQWVVRSDVSRKLERERDEAREAWNVMQSSFERSRDEVEKLIRERDEAREEAAFWHKLYKQFSIWDETK